MTAAPYPDLEHAHAEIIALKHKALRMLERRFPIGAGVSFFIAAGQVNPSTGTVISLRHSDSGFAVRVRHHEAKKNSRYQFREVPVDGNLHLLEQST